MTHSTEEHDYTTIDVGSMDEPLPPYSSNYGKISEKDGDEKKRSFKDRITRTWTNSISPLASSGARSTSRFWEKQAWPAMKKFRFTKRQVYAFSLLLVFGILPFFLYGHFMSDEVRFYYLVFAAKTISCGDSFNTPQNSTVEGVEALFVLDASFGSFTFSQVKTIDVAWDVIVGRGAQFLAWWVSYNVFSDALLRLIERHPAPYETFMRLGLEGPCLSSGWTLLVELFRKRSKRTWGLFFFMFISTIYVLSIPTIIQAMTGYNSRTIAWVSLDGDDNIVPASFFQSGYVVVGTWNSTFAEPTCEANDELNAYYDQLLSLKNNCDCKLPNGTILPYQDWFPGRGYVDYGYSMRDQYSMFDCHFNYTGNTQTYQSSNETWGTQPCNMTHPIKLGNETYPVSRLNITHGYCWDKKGYEQAIADTTRCLPDTSHPSYQWGFSTMLLGVFFILQLIWSIAMYVIWQDAQFLSKLVKGGFRITQLRTAFVLAEAARRRTALEDEELVQKDEKELKRDLFGTKKRRGAEVERDMFWEGTEFRKRKIAEAEREV